MTAITFDTLKFTKRLTRSGASPELAEATAEAFKDAQHESEVATKTDINLLRSDLGGQIGSLANKIDSLESKIDTTRWILLILTIAVIAPQLKGIF
uniref:DUF1640 domain-containing protein n=1 Tax=Candidatus Kentrum sp. DK TaxID=2126562 RepID=A0A450S5W1_9GAMM|nr:MAG: hypothetical protein BECKDK2373B_GA0170837_101628 [Candidatus Kentron sp. DK]VFJ53875.1 MAG: hypothetical protein BECKDK2373C_GA0170839_10415 [Candidatus Kentron sp. DK]